RLPKCVLGEGVVRRNERRLLRRTSRLFLCGNARRRVNHGPEKLSNINPLIMLICRLDVAGIKVDGRSGQFVGEKTSRRVVAPVAHRKQTVTSFDGLARRGGATNTRVRSSESSGSLGDSSFGAVQRRDLHLKSFGELHDLPADAEAACIQ